MIKAEIKPAIAAVKELFAQNPDGLKELVRAVMTRDARGGDGGRTWGRQRRALRRSAGLPVGLLRSDADHSRG
jgi:hypothetical protein